MNIESTRSTITVNIVKIDGSKLTISKLQNLLYLPAEEWINKIDNNQTDFKVVGLIPINVFIKIHRSQNKLKVGYISEKEYKANHIHIKSDRSIGCLIHDSGRNVLFISYVEFITNNYWHLFAGNKGIIEQWDELEIQEKLKESKTITIEDKYKTIGFKNLESLLYLFNHGLEYKKPWAKKDLLLYQYLIHLNIQDKNPDTNFEKRFSDFTNKFFDVEFEVDNKDDMLFLVMKLNSMNCEYKLSESYNAANKYINDYQQNNKVDIENFNLAYTDLLAGTDESNELKREKINQVFNAIKSRPLLFL